MTSLSGRQTLIKESSRSNSWNTASNAESAAGSSEVHAVSRSSEPIKTRERSTSPADWAGGAAGLHAAEHRSTAIAETARAARRLWASEIFTIDGQSSTA